MTESSAVERELRAQLAASEAVIGELRERVANLERLEKALHLARKENDALEWRVNQAQIVIAEIRATQSWRLTAPLRRCKTLLNHLGLGLKAWLLLKPGGRPRRLLDAALARLEPPKPPAVEACYVFVDHAIACPTNTGVQRVTRGLAKALLASGQRDIRFVKWSATANACVLIDSEDRNHLARWNGPALSDGEARLYPPRGASPVCVQAGATGWLIVPEVTHITFQAEPVAPACTQTGEAPLGG